MNSDVLFLTAQARLWTTLEVAALLGQRQSTGAGSSHNLFGRMPMQFAGDRSQTDDQAKFGARVQSYTAFLTSVWAILSLHRPNPRCAERSDTAGAGLLVCVRGSGPSACRTTGATANERNSIL